MKLMKTGIEIIETERNRQMTQEGWLPEHDDTHSEGQLAGAAACYAMHAAGFTFAENTLSLYKGFYNKVNVWPWERKWWKPSPKDPIRDLAKAGALIAAEIDRLNRKSETP